MPGAGAFEVAAYCMLMRRKAAVTGKETQTEIEDVREDDVAGVPHDPAEPEQAPKAAPSNDRQDAETVSGS